jgi:hypothetical protein
VENRLKSSPGNDGKTFAAFDKGSELVKPVYARDANMFLQVIRSSWSISLQAANRPVHNRVRSTAQRLLIIVPCASAHQEKSEN